MREKRQKQMPLMNHIQDHTQGKELEMISRVIDNTPTIPELILQDLNSGKSPVQRAGATGMSADQVLIPFCIQDDFNIHSQPVKERSDAGEFSNRFRPLAA